MSQYGSINYVAHVPWLQGKAHNVYTQFGEDGLIAACLQRIGETNRHCFEIGAADGRFFSNTLLLREQGWFSVLIEGNEKLFDKLQADYGNESTCIHRLCSDLDSLLRETDIHTEADLGIIDIDGQDYWMWHDLQDVQPRIMLVEISTHGASSSIPKRGQPYPAQAGLVAIQSLGIQKGYTLVASTFCNALFVKDSCLN